MEIPLEFDDLEDLEDRLDYRTIKTSLTSLLHAHSHYTTGFRVYIPTFNTEANQLIDEGTIKPGFSFNASA